MATAEQTSRKNINRQIKNICRNQTTLRDNIQAVLVDIVVHGKEHGDVTPMADLLNKMGRAVTRISGVTRFMAHHTSIRVSADSKNKGLVKARLAKDEETGNKIGISAEMIDAVKANNWWEFEVPPVESVVTIEDIDKRVNGVISFIDRLLDNKSDTKKLYAGDRDAASKLRNKLDGLMKRSLDRAEGDDDSAAAA